MTTNLSFFKLRQISVKCPSCETPFATFELARTPAVTAQTPMEADLHRVLPDAHLRAALIAMCPSCIYTWWLTSFQEFHLLPQVVADSPPVSPSKKFAHAVHSGRQFEVHAVDQAVLALNGYWCSREEGMDGKKFLQLAKVQLIQALADNDWSGNRSRYAYILGEVHRLLGEFGEARFRYEQVDKMAGLPLELVDRMTMFAANGNNNPVRLPPHMVEAIFLNKRSATA